MKKMTLKFSAVLIICITFMCSGMSVYADESTPPSIPMSVSGSVISTTGAPASGSIEAILDGKTVGSTSINSNGTFGGSGLVPQLLVQGSYSENNDHPVTFKVNGGSATASIAITFHAGTNVNNVVITATIASPPYVPPTGGGGGLPGGDLGGTPIPTPTPTPTGKPVTPPKSKATPVPVDTSKNIIKSDKAADGKVTTTVTQDDKALADALDKAFKQDNHGDAPIVTITFNNAVGEAVVFNVSAATLALAALDSPNTLISFQTNDGEYSLPLSVINFSSLAQSLGTTTGNISIQVKIATVNSSVNDKIDAAAKNAGTSQLGTAIEFTITATGNGKTVELNNFGSTYVDRNIVLALPVDDTHATVVLYDPITGEFSFVPALFQKLEDGTTKVTFKRNGNSIYTVLSSTKTFNDVSKHWAKADIELLASKLVVKGTTDTTFSPDNSITRAEFAALLVRSLGLTADAASAASFKDVKASDWFAGAVGAAAKAKLVSGFEDKSFKPNDTITREQMAVMVARAISAAGKKSADSASSSALAKFTDKASISSWAQAAVAQSVDAKIISGMTDKTFVPAANASRAQAVVMLKRLLQYTAFIN